MTMPNLPSMSPEARTALRRTQKLAERLARRAREVKRFEAYFRGKHPLAYATKEWSADHAARYENFSDNWCGVVASAPAERTFIDGFHLDTGDRSETQTPQEKQLWDDWLTNQMPLQSSQGFLMSTIARRSAVLIWGDRNSEPVVTWERPDQVYIDYDPGRPFAGRDSVKVWCDDDLELATYYDDDTVWKWQRQRVAGTVTEGRTEGGLYVPTSYSGTFGGGGWRPRDTNYSGDDTWPIGNPLGEQPFEEFQNRPILGGDPLSDIDGTIAMQDAINLLWAYLFAAADFASMPARVVMGLQPPKMPILDENGVKIGEKAIEIEDLQRGRLLWLTGQGGDIKQWDAAKLDVFTAVINVAVKHVASQTRTPIHYIVGDLGNVNGETLTATETPLAMKVNESHGFYTPPTQGTFRKMALVRGDDDVAEACRRGRVQWRGAETRSEAQLSDAAVKDRSIGWPFEALLERRYGLSQTEIKRIMAMRQREQDAAVTSGLEGLFRNTPPPVPESGQPVPGSGQPVPAGQ